MDDYIVFWGLVFRCYPNVAFPHKDVVRLRAEDTQEFPLKALQEAFKVYRKTPGKDFPPTAGALIAIMDPLSTPEGVEVFANHIFDKVIAIGRGNNMREKLSDFENKVLDQSKYLCSEILNCEHRVSVVKSIRAAIHRAKDPARMEQLGQDGHLLGNEWKDKGKTSKIDLTAFSGLKEIE